MLTPLLPSPFSARRPPARVAPSPQTGTVGISLDDGRIAAAVRTALVNERDLGLRDIAVDVRQGVVFLSGEVRTLEEAQHAATVIRGVPGVRDLTSSLSVNP